MFDFVLSLFNRAVGWPNEPFEKDPEAERLLEEIDHALSKLDKTHDILVVPEAALDSVREDVMKIGVPDLQNVAVIRARG